MKEYFIETMRNLIVLMALFACPAMAQQDQVSQQAQENNVNRGAALEIAVYSEIKNEIKDIKSEMESTRNEIREEKDLNKDIYQLLATIFALIDIFFIGILVYARKLYKENIAKLQSDVLASSSKKLNSDLGLLIKNKSKELDEKLSEFLRRIEEKNFQYMQITSLAVSGNHDEALDESGWKGDYKKYEEEPEAYQRILISCLARSKKRREENNNLIAWQWSRRLLEKSQNYRNAESMIQNGITTKHFEEAIAEYDKISESLSAEERDLCEPIIFVAIRRARNSLNYESHTARLRDLAAKHRSQADLKMATNFAAFYRDEGQFEEAERVLRLNIQRLTGTRPAEDGWERLFNTHIANCIDQGKPEGAINQARTLLVNSKRPDNLFTCVRFAWMLQEVSAERDSLLSSAEEIMQKYSFPEGDDGTIKSKALLLEIRGKKHEAVAILEDAIAKNKERSDKFSENNLYYFRSLLSQIYIHRGDEGSIAKAIEVLTGLVVKDEIGEARFFLAKAYAMQKNIESAKISLEIALKIKRKWIAIAGNDKEFKGHSFVSALLMSSAR